MSFFCAIQLLYLAPQTYRTRRHTIVRLGTTCSTNICAIQLLYWAPQTYRTRRHTIFILGTTLAQHKHLCNTIVIFGTTNISHASQYNCYIGNHILNRSICAIQLLYWAPQTYRTPRHTIVILGTTLAQHKHLCNTIVIFGTTNISHAWCSIQRLNQPPHPHPR